MRATRAVWQPAVTGIKGIAGPVMCPIYPDAGMALLVGSIGTETGTTGTSPTSSTTLASAAAAGDTTVTLTATFVDTDIIQIGTGAGAECRKVVGTPTGGGPFVATLDRALHLAHSNGATVAKVVAPFTHTITAADRLPSWTFEKNMDGADIQYAGCIIGKADLNFPNNAECRATYAIVGQQDAVLGSPTAQTWPTDTPFGPTNVAVSLRGAQDYTPASATVTIDNAAKAYATLNGQDYPEIVIATQRKVTAKFTLFLQSLTTYYADLTSAAIQAGSIVVTQGTNVLTLTLPSGVITKYSNPIKMGDLVMQDIDYQWLMNSSGVDISATLVNSNHLNY